MKCVWTWWTGLTLQSTPITTISQLVQHLISTDSPSVATTVQQVVYNSCRDARKPVIRVPDQFRLQRLARIVKLCLLQVLIRLFPINELQCADQAALMRRLVCVFVARKFLKTRFLA